MKKKQGCRSATTSTTADSRSRSRPHVAPRAHRAPHPGILRTVPALGEARASRPVAPGSLPSGGTTGKVQTTKQMSRQRVVFAGSAPCHIGIRLGVCARHEWHTLAARASGPECGGRPVSMFAGRRSQQNTKPEVPRVWNIGRRVDRRHTQHTCDVGNTYMGCTVRAQESTPGRRQILEFGVGTVQYLYVISAVLPAR